MTTEPKFIPSEAAKIKLGENLSFKVRMIDCVGYLIPEAIGHMDGNDPRMVSTPWSDEKIPFIEAAEMGTKKVISEHSTIGIVITTDGSITDIKRDSYLDAETRVISELKELKKPFIILLNTSKPYDKETEETRLSLAKAHNVPVMIVNCAQLKNEDINNIMEKILYEFPIKELKFHFPKWIETLNLDHWLKQSVIESIKNIIIDINKLREVNLKLNLLDENPYIKKSYLNKIELGQGCANIEINIDDNLFYKVLSETTDMEIQSEYELISTIKVLAAAKKEYDKVKYALDEVKRKGYGIVTPALEEMSLEEPMIVRHGSKYGVKIKAHARSLHLIRADIETEVSPIVGSEKQAEELIAYLNEEMTKEESGIWELNMFGKSMHDLVKDGLQNKLFRMPEDAQMKLQETLQRMINEGSGGLICIIL
jgi:stage IV sporulation protein A